MTISSTTMVKEAKKRRRRVYLSRSWQLYLMLVPVVLFYAIFHFGAMPGLMMAFQDFRLAHGIAGSPFVGLAHFRRLFASTFFFNVVRNTLVLNLMNLVFFFPAPIILAILLNEVRDGIFKRTSQSLMYLPHFFSWVVLAGMVIELLSPSRGIVNAILYRVTGETIHFMASRAWWRFIFVGSTIWKDVGWGSIIFLAAISGIDAELYEAARMDGAGRIRQIWHITLPGIKATIVILLILRLGSVFTVGVEQVMMLSNIAVMDIADVIPTYTFRVGVQQGRFSITTAIGIFQSVINMFLILSANWIAKWSTGTSVI